MRLAPVILLLGLALNSGCGSRTDARRSIDGGALRARTEERCNALDDDGINGVDDPFRDSRGRYVTDEHCGACNQVCAPRSAAELVAHCGLIDELPRCIAERCEQGYGPTRDGRCEPLDDRLCLACANDNDCGALTSARCANIAGEARCTVGCALGCPSGYRCAGEVCVPEGGSCSCTAGQDFSLACSVEGATSMGAMPLCVGRARCTDGVLSGCVVDVEVCDHDDNDCDGEVDEGFRDARGAYSLDPNHCGECGVSCEEDTGLELQLACGGDPFAPRCTLACPDALDGIQVGDMLDGDLDVATGCECRVSVIEDQPGPVGGRDESLDVNCDGADGIVLASFYVATDGDDSYPGSPTRPLRTIGAALTRAQASLGTPLARPHVFIAGGVYTETLSIAEGVQVHGGYRRDFRALDPAAFAVEVRAPSNTSAPGGAAMIGVDVGIQPTLIEGISLRGRDATGPGQATLGMYLERPGPNLTIRGSIVRAGLPGEGVTGSDGVAGASPSTLAGEGQPPRAAREQGLGRVCIEDASNIAQGGQGGQTSCAGANVSGGAGGDARCPRYDAVSASQFQGAGQRGGGGSGGAGGGGGQDANGPIEGSSGGGCPSAVCCGLADFTVPSNYTGPRAGENGRDGSSGTAGTGCRDARGSFVAGTWSGAAGSAGTAGQPGSGGGGGGAGGGVQMDFRAGLCEFADGLGGGGGGGGGGGCGGAAGEAGTSGAPSVALLVSEPSAFTLDGVTFVPSAGGRGGPGGAGGDGGLGGAGAAGGNIPPEQRTTPTLAGTFPGARGGSGGVGGAGGGGGGGCGGSSVGIWIAGAEPSTGSLWRARNIFQLGGGGSGGAGGGGAQFGSSGADGGAVDVVVQR